MCYITVFGPTHSGKSTLMGYIYTHDFDEKKYQDELKEIRKKMAQKGQQYYQDLALAYFFDTGSDERRRYDKKDENSIGTSKRLHIIEGVNTDITYIDTPGSDAEYNNRYNGQFMGEYGVYLVEVGLFDKLRESEGVDEEEYKKLKKRIFAPLFLWNAYKDINNVIIVVSKCDPPSFDVELFNWIKETIYEFFEDIEIIPISINVYERKGYNIYDNDLSFAEYNGKSLIDKISEIIKDNPEDKESEPTFAFIDTFLDSKKVIRLKVLNGNLKKGDLLNIGPIKKKSDNLNVFLQGRILSINEDGERVDYLRAGKIGTIKIEGVCDKLSEKMGEKKRVSVYKLKRTTILYGEHVEIKKGNLLSFIFDLDKMSQKDKISLLQFTINDQIEVIWLGRSIYSYILGIYKEENKFIITIFNQKSEPSLFVMPLNYDKTFLYNSFIVCLKNEHYVCCQLSSIGNLNDKTLVILKFTNEFELDLEEEIKNRFSVGCTTSIDKHQNYIITLELKHHYIFAEIRKFLKEYHITNYSLEYK